MTLLHLQGFLVVVIEMFCSLLRYIKNANDVIVHILNLKQQEFKYLKNKNNFKNLFINPLPS